MYSTNYTDAFIAVSPDCPAKRGEAPAGEGTIAGLQYELLRNRPYELTSDELLFEIHRRRKAIPEDELAEAREAFFAEPKACLRCSPLAKRFGWGLHHDARSRVAIYPVESEDYRRLSGQAGLQVVSAMRNRRG